MSDKFSEEHFGESNIDLNYVLCNFRVTFAVLARVEINAHCAQKLFSHVPLEQGETRVHPSRVSPMGREVEACRHWEAPERAKEPCLAEHDPRLSSVCKKLVVQYWRGGKVSTLRLISNMIYLPLCLKVIQNMKL